MIALLPPLIAFYPWLSSWRVGKSQPWYEPFEPAAHSITNHFTYCQRLATQLATQKSTSGSIDPRVAAEDLANVLAPFVPYPFESILVFDASGQVVARIRAGRDKTPITAAETSGIEEAGTAPGALIQFDTGRTLVRFFQPVVRDGVRQGFLCLEARILPSGDWFLMRNGQVILSEQPAEALRGRTFQAWAIEGGGAGRYDLCCVQQARTTTMAGAAAALAASLALQLAILLLWRSSARIRRGDS